MNTEKVFFAFMVVLAFLVCGCIPKHPTRTVRPEAIAGEWQERTVVSESGHEYSYLFAPGPSQDAPAMVLLPGGFFDDRIWLYADGLAERFNVYALDWPSNSLFFTGRVEDFGEIALDFVDALNLDEIYLAGVSMGTYAAVDLASRQESRDRVKALVLASTVMFVVTEDEVKRRIKYGRMALGFAPERLRSMVEWQAGRTELPEADGPIQQEEFFWVRPYSYYYQVFSMMVNQGDEKQDTMSVSCPVLFLHGTEDETMPVDIARLNPTVFADAAWVELEGKTHSMVFSDGPLVVEKIEEFLKARDLIPVPQAAASSSQGVGPACEMLGTSQDCSEGRICCPLPPTLYEQPRCLTDCRGSQTGTCEELLGPGSECNSEDGCCFTPKVRRFSRSL